MNATLIPAGLSFDTANPFTAQVLSTSGQHITSIAETTRANVQRIISASYNNGFSIPDTAKAIKVGMKEASTSRARLIARTELVGAANGGSIAAVKQVAASTGTTYKKVWMTAPGAVHPRHADYDGLDGQSVGLHDPFDVGGFAMDYPGDQKGPVEEVANCRCSISYTEETADAGGGAAIDTGGGVSAIEGETVDVTKAAVAGVVPDTVSVGAGPPVPQEYLKVIKDEGLDKWPPSRDPAVLNLLGDAVDTEAKYRGTNGKWSPELVA